MKKTETKNLTMKLSLGDAIRASGDTSLKSTDIHEAQMEVSLKFHRHKW
jgi:hypothetical protein